MLTEHTRALIRALARSFDDIPLIIELHIILFGFLLAAPFQRRGWIGKRKDSIVLQTQRKNKKTSYNINITNETERGEELTK